ncbi:MAG: hypothetical protein JNK63_07875 [Chthonomonas sp.]|nr:hypothetical protein [Chthonomonas sp.]
MNFYCENQVPWPKGKPFTQDRKSGQFRANGRSISVGAAADRVRAAVSAFTKPGKNWRTTELWIYVDGAKVGARGEFLYNQPASVPPQVVVSFDLDGEGYTIAVDKLDDAGQNLAAIAQYIESLRATERYGVFTVRELLQTFAALPASGGFPRPVSPFDGLRTRKEVNDLWRDLSRSAHPDTGGSNEAMALLNLQRDEALERVK